jgi:hypothetical protein
LVARHLRAARSAVTDRNAVIPVTTDNDHDDRPDGLLRLLQRELKRRGLLPSLVSKPDAEGREMPSDRIAVTNPTAPERGVIYVEDSGCLTWERPANPHDGEAGKIAAEAASILQDARRADESANPSGHRELTGTYQQQLVFLNTHWGSSYVFSAPQT